MLHIPILFCSNWINLFCMKQLAKNRHLLSHEYSICQNVMKIASSVRRQSNKTHKSQVLRACGNSELRGMLRILSTKFSILKMRILRWENCVKLVPKELTDDLKAQLLANRTEMVQRIEANERNWLDTIVIGNVGFSIRFLDKKKMK